MIPKNYIFWPAMNSSITSYDFHFWAGYPSLLSFCLYTYHSSISNVTPTHRRSHMIKGGTCHGLSGVWVLLTLFGTSFPLILIIIWSVFFWIPHLLVLFWAQWTLSLMLTIIHCTRYLISYINCLTTENNFSVPWI